MLSLFFIVGQILKSKLRMILCIKSIPNIRIIGEKSKDPNGGIIPRTKVNAGLVMRNIGAKYGKRRLDGNQLNITCAKIAKEKS